MAISYVAVTLIIILLLESMVVGVVLFIFTRSPFTSYWVMQSANLTAQIFALQAAVQSDDIALNPATTFDPGSPESLLLENEINSQETAWFHLTIPYIEPGSSPPERVPIGILLGPEGEVISSSYPDQFPATSDAIETIPEDNDLIQGALAGNSHGTVRTTPTGRIVSVAHPIWNRDKEVLGAVYIQTPAGAPPDTNLLPELASIMIPSGIVWLCLTLPIGVVFGVLSTRGLIRRIERLANATAHFKGGDTSIRVPVGRADEVGQLEGQFNEMAEQLVENFEQRQVMAEQSARREERARIEQEMSSARYIQQSLLPKELPQISGWTIQTDYLPARAVGGDLFDFLELPDGRMGIVIGDATGSGVPSALIMATTSAILHATAASVSATPGKVLEQVNNLLQLHIPDGTFATCFYAILDPVRGTLQYANAGHNLPYLSRNGEVIELHARGMPLGLMPDQEYTEEEITIHTNESILFYTDGIVEAHNQEGEMYGTPRLKRLILEQDHRDGLISLLKRDLNEFAGSEWEREDDVTFVLLRRSQ